MENGRCEGLWFLTVIQSTSNCCTEHETTVKLLELLYLSIHFFLFHSLTHSLISLLFSFSDIDECVVSSVVPCDEDSERCVNSPGSYSCKCKAGYTRYRGECKLWEEAERLRNQDPPENKKKKKKNTSKAQEGERGGDSKKRGRVSFPWYHLLLPTAIWYLGYKYVRPTLATTVAMAFGLSAIYMLGDKL